MKYSREMNRLNNLLRKECSRETRKEILDMFVNLSEEKEEIMRRTCWLEELIDSADMEKEFVEYQRKFNIETWSGS
jgi:Trp operon repressor